MLGDGHQRRAADVAEPLQRVVRAHGLPLVAEAGERLRIRIGERVLQQELDELGTLRVGDGGEQPQRERAQPLLAPEARPQLAPDVGQGVHVGIRPRQRRVQLQRAHTRGMPQRDLLGDHAAHRDAAHVRTGDAEHVHEPHGVVGHHRRGVGSVGRVRLADAAIVEGDHAVLRGEGGDLQAPREVIAAEAHDEHERVAGARLDVKHLDVADADGGQRLRLSRWRRRCAPGRPPSGSG